jgi:quercetin dioxygenase-like cupin family protein
VRLQTSGAKIVAEPLRLKELVVYPTGAIVSRMLIDEDGGNVTLFAFDENQALSEHTAPFDALAIVIEGKVNIRSREVTRSRKDS